MSKKLPKTTSTHPKRLLPQSPSQQQIDALLSNYNAGNFDAAEQHAKELIQKFPNLAFGWNALGAIAKKTGRLQDSVAAARQSILLEPYDAFTHSNLGVILKELGRLTEAEGSYREAIRLKPDYAEAHSNLGNTLKELGRLKEALAACREAIRLKPDFAEAHNNLGNALKDLGRLAEAEASYREAIRFKPGYARAQSNLGVTLRETGRLAEAEASCQEAIRLQPDFAEAHNNLGIAFKELGQLKKALASFQAAIYLQPDFAEAHNNLGNALKDLGRSMEAQASYQEAIRLKPDYAEAHSNLLFGLNYVESLSAEAALIQAKRYGSLVSARATSKFTSWSSGAESMKLRIGFVSGDLRNHVVGYFIEGLIKHLDQSQFDIYAFPTTPMQDDLTNRIRPHFQDWLPLFGMSDLEAATLIHQRGIQVLIDLSGHTAHNRLAVFSYKPAPVQASWLGYFATTGIPEMDYFLGDPYMSPTTEECYFSEKIWSLPSTWLCLTPPNEPILISQLPALKNGCVTFGCFGNLSKMNSEVVKQWAALLQLIPNSKLFLKAKQLADALVVAETQSRFASQGIHGDRLILEGPSSRKEYLEAYNRVDIVLDTFPYPGGTTSTEALWMGAPVLTLKGDRFLSHLGESIAHNGGQKDWIAEDLDDYVNKAIAFASDLQYLATLRATLRDQVLQSPLFDAKRFAKNFGEAAWGMLRDKSCSSPLS